MFNISLVFEIFASGGSFRAMDVPTYPDLGDLFKGPDDDEGAEDDEGPASIFAEGSDKPALKGFRKRWRRKSQAMEADTVPSPSLVDSEVLTAPKGHLPQSEAGLSSNSDNVHR
jgi:hypothetical protein